MAPHGHDTNVKRWSRSNAAPSVAEQPHPCKARTVTVARCNPRRSTPCGLRLLPLREPDILDRQGSSWGSVVVFVIILDLDDTMARHRFAILGTHHPEGAARHGRRAAAAARQRPKREGHGTKSTMGGRRAHRCLSISIGPHPGERPEPTKTASTGGSEKATLFSSAHGDTLIDSKARRQRWRRMRA